MADTNMKEIGGEDDNFDDYEDDKEADKQQFDWYIINS